MVRLLLTRNRQGIRANAFAFAMVLALITTAWSGEKQPPAPQVGPELTMDGGRKLTYEGSFSSESEVQGKRGFFKKVLDVVIGATEYRRLVRPYGIARDSRGRIIVTDPGAAGVHIFDFSEKKYKFLSRWDKGKDAMRTPQCVHSTSTFSNVAAVTARRVLNAASSEEKCYSSA